ncbi:PilN domain-containing protein [Psychromonas sp. KJ10-10]|uniref:PilN domain-containing protein n=1 Tax=Psychromonas sp. KJ10-10 TaxID=3391823 RepID=UPI0039B45F0D
MYVDSLISAQNQRNQFLQTQTIIIDRRIAEIRTIKKEKAELERRINLIQTLEEKRNDATRLFNTLADTVPAGVYLLTSSFNNEKVVVQGTAESNNRVTTMMRNVDGSGWLGILTYVILKKVLQNRLNSIILGWISKLFLNSKELNNGY